MGLFNTIKCEKPLPDGLDASSVWLQTKDLNECPIDLATYTISSDNKLLDSDGKEVNFHGWLNFYGSVGDPNNQGPDSDYAWHEYNAKFTDGRLEKIVIVEDGA